MNNDAPITERCIYCEQVIATTPIIRHEKTPDGIPYAVAGEPTLTEIGQQRCPVERAKTRNNGQHLSSTDLMLRDDKTLMPY